jgi:hypothetical protein
LDFAADFFAAATNGSYHDRGNEATNVLRRLVDRRNFHR